MVRRAYTDPGQSPAKRTKRDEPPQLPQLNFMDLTETPQRPTAPKKRIRRKQSAQTLPDKRPRETRNSAHFFTRAATIDLAYGATASPSPRFDDALSSGQPPPKHKPGFPIASLPMDAVNTCPKFYRRRLDASTRNRLYFRDEDEGALSKNSQRLFRKVPGSLFGGLVLHSSLVGSVPARMTNSVDIYSLH
ncbi:hypothetical protein K491DRAFT_611748 [Lophiostoma macrostomum CBS 122681]|uniref:Uncharacterized protein n=1 Tax=Lophiostoma macrostomum CBS 122681 TaxID=1314788 RepID=A0A6A6SPQ3_9PLEO|nr:hypothetical protein K491DRAFT_611748 [Lophiostoma macrostomum CBS 122681]